MVQKLDDSEIVSFKELLMANSSQAEPLCKRSLKIREKTLRPDHPDVATTCENMAGLYRQIGKEDEAEILEARARKIRSK